MQAVQGGITLEVHAYSRSRSPGKVSEFPSRLARVIRSYDTEDLAGLLEVWYDASQIAHSFLTSEFFEQEREKIIHDYLPVAETWVFEEGSRVIGFISMIGDEVGAIFVSPEHQGKGVGRSLMDHAGRSRDHLEVEVFEANAIGRSFYTACGFEVIEKHVQAETGHPVLRLRLQL